jgi:hypothetical protein
MTPLDSTSPQSQPGLFVLLETREAITPQRLMAVRALVGFLSTLVRPVVYDGLKRLGCAELGGLVTLGTATVTGSDRPGDKTELEKLGRLLAGSDPGSDNAFSLAGSAHASSVPASGTPLA